MEEEATWVVRYFRRHEDDDPDGTCLGQQFLRDCPKSVRAKFFNVLIAVAKAPPHRFAGGGYWEAMHGDMRGYYEVRLDGPDRRHYRLFCLLETNPPGYAEPTLVIVCGLSKPFLTEFSDADYAWVRSVGDEYRSRRPRSLT